MKEKQEIVIKEVKAWFSGVTIFHVSFGEMQLLVSGTFDLFAFNNKGYFTKLVNNFKEEGKVTYLLFRSLTWHEPGAGGASMEKIKETLALSSAYFTLARTEPGESRLLKRLGEEIHLLMLKDNLLIKLPKILENIDSKGTWCFFIFSTESDKDNLFSKIDALYRRGALGDQKDLFSLGLDMIKFGSQGLWADYGLDISTHRFNATQIKDMMLNSVNKDEFEVIVK